MSSAKPTFLKWQKSIPERPRPQTGRAVYSRQPQGGPRKPRRPSAPPPRKVPGGRPHTHPAAAPGNTPGEKQREKGEGRSVGSQRVGNQTRAPRSKKRPRIRRRRNTGVSGRKSNPAAPQRRLRRRSGRRWIICLATRGDGRIALSEAIFPAPPNFSSLPRSYRCPFAKPCQGCRLDPGPRPTRQPATCKQERAARAPRAALTSATLPGN